MPPRTRRALLCPTRRVRALDGPPQVRAEDPGKPVDCKGRHGGFALLGETRGQLAGDLNHADPRARNIGQQGCGVRVSRFLEYVGVALDPERIAGKFDRDVLVTAEPELADRLGLTRG